MTAQPRIYDFLRQRQQAFARSLRSRGVNLPSTTVLRGAVRLLSDGSNVLGYASDTDYAPQVNESKACATFTITTPRKDRYGDIVLPNGCKAHLANYQQNPQVFFGHRSTDLPIALARSPEGIFDLTIDPANNFIRSTAYFHLQTAESECVFRLVAKKILRATSIGFLPVKAVILQDNGSEEEFDEDGEEVLEFSAFRALKFLEWDLLEYSVVSIPANPDCIDEVSSILSRGAIGDTKLPTSIRRSLEPFATAPRSWANGIDLSRLYKSRIAEDFAAKDVAAGQQDPTNPKLLGLPDIRQPNHFSCILPGQELQGCVIGGSKAWYSGQAIEILTASGIRLAVTTNHPVMTTAGFATAGDLKKGNRLLRYIGKDKSLGCANDVEYAPTLVEKVFSTLCSLSSVVASRKVIPFADDFHGDGLRFQSEIEVVGTYSKLRRDSISPSQKTCHEPELVSSLSSKRKLQSCCQFDSSLQRFDTTSRSLMSRLDLSSTLGGSLSCPISFTGNGEFVTYFGPLHGQTASFARSTKCDTSFSEPSLNYAGRNLQTVSDCGSRLSTLIPTDNSLNVDCDPIVRFGMAAQLDVGLTQDSIDRVTASRILASELLDRNASDVVTDEILDVHEFLYSGWVYDFESPYGYILVNNLCLSNCGAASACAVGKYFGVGPDNIEDWMEALGTTAERSTHPKAIEEYLRSLGLTVNARSDLTLDDLRTAWLAGSPVICCVQDYGPYIPDEAEFDYGHYVAVVGLGFDYVFAQDPSDSNVEADSGTIDALGKIMVDEETWLKNWHDVDADGNKYQNYGIIVSAPLPLTDSSKDKASLVTDTQLLQDAAAVADVKAWHRLSDSDLHALVAAGHPLKDIRKATRNRVRRWLKQLETLPSETPVVSTPAPEVLTKTSPTENPEVKDGSFVNHDENTTTPPPDDGPSLKDIHSLLKDLHCSLSEHKGKSEASHSELRDMVKSLHEKVDGMTKAAPAPEVRTAPTTPTAPAVADELDITAILAALQPLQEGQAKLQQQLFEATGVE